MFVDKLKKNFFIEWMSEDYLEIIECRLKINFKFTNITTKTLE